MFFVEVVKLYFSGYNVEEIKDVIGRSRQQVWNIRTKASKYEAARKTRQLRPSKKMTLIELVCEIRVSARI